jgi:hypothetical protein
MTGNASDQEGYATRPAEPSSLLECHKRPSLLVHETGTSFWRRSGTFRYRLTLRVRASSLPKQTCKLDYTKQRSCSDSKHCGHLLKPGDSFLQLASHLQPPGHVRNIKHLQLTQLTRQLQGRQLTAQVLQDISSSSSSSTGIVAMALTLVLPCTRYDKRGMCCRKCC